jgi:hypothetical protein
MTNDNLLILGATAAAGLLVWLAWKSRSAAAGGVYGVDWHYGSNFEIINGAYTPQENLADGAFWESLGLSSWQG